MNVPKSVIAACCRSKSIRSQVGTGMIEVLIAMSLMAVGLLGVLSMQTLGLRSNQRAVFVTEAQMMTEDMVNMIMAFDDLNDPGRTVALFDGLQTSAGASRASCATGCSREAQVEHDKSDWSSQIEERLPGGFGQVLANDVGDYTVLIVTVMWDGALKGVTGEPVGLVGGRVECPTDLACYSIEVNI